MLYMPGLNLLFSVKSCECINDLVQMVVFHGLGLFPRPGHSSRNPSTPPQKNNNNNNSLGKLRGIRSPPGLDRQDKTGTGQGQDSPPGLNRQEQDSPQEQEALLG